MYDECRIRGIETPALMSVSAMRALLRSNDASARFNELRTTDINYEQWSEVRVFEECHIRGIETPLRMRASRMRALLRSDDEEFDAGRRSQIQPKK